jgi:N-acyl-D-aspartate/D-glutamate deacylase
MNRRAALRTLALISLPAKVATHPTAERRAQSDFDLVVRHGRVMDPESGLDAVRNIGIRRGQIAAISVQPLIGRQTIDATGLAVAPGFIDLHSHGQDERDARLQAQDGVTTALDVEHGVYPVAAWYASREGKAPIHYGATAGWDAARVKLKHGLDVGHMPTDHAHSELRTTLQGWARDKATPEEIDRLIELLNQALDEGALGLGVHMEYTPGVGRDEVYRMFQFAARRGATVVVCKRLTDGREPANVLDGVQEALANAAATGASLHLAHVTSSCIQQTPFVLEMISHLRKSGVDVSTEVYPYTAGAAQLPSATHDEGWPERRGIPYSDLQWAATGERLTKESWERYRKQSGLLIIHSMSEAIVDVAIAHPLVMIVSAAVPYDTGGEHPRGAGTFSRVLGRYVRERGRLSLMDALRKMTLMPAQRLERFVPMMRHKGRLRVGADADITAFDPATVVDRATYEKPMQPSAGIVHVIVGGISIVRDGTFIEDIFPGRAVRRTR